jgi:hypothetical protein
MEIELNAAEAASYLRRPSTSLAAFRGLLGADAARSRALGRMERPAFGYAAFEVTAGLERAFALIRTTLVCFDLVAVDDEARWTLAGRDPDLRLTLLTADVSTSDHTLFLHALRLGEYPKTCRVDSGVDLAGLRIGADVLLFHNEPRMNRSALSFAVEDGPPELRAFVAGVAPGAWQLWRDGWLEATLHVQPREGGLSFETRPGRFFLRRLG